MVVVDIGCLKETKGNTLLHHYHGDLRTLFGSRYPDLIDRLYFILTKNDQHQMTKSEIIEKMRDMQDDLVDDDFLATRFLKRMRKHHVVADLKTNDGEALLERINGLVESDLDTKRKLHKTTEWQIDGLKGGENKLIQMCMTQIEFLQAKSIKFVEDVEAIKEQFGKRKVGLNSEVNVVQTEIVSSQSKHDNLVKEQRDAEKEIELYEERKAGIARDLTDARELLSMHEKQMKVFEEEFVSSDLVTLRVDVAKQVSKNFQKTEYKLQINAAIMADGSKEHVFLVMEYEPNDETLRSFIGCNGSLIPENLGSVKNIDLPTVMYNSHRMINRCNATSESANGVLSVRVIHPKPFKIYIYSARPFKEHQVFGSFKRIVSRNMQKDEDRIASLQASRKKLDEGRGTNIVRVREIKGLLSDLEESSLALNQKLLSMGAEHEETYAGMKDTVHEKQEQQSKLTSDPSIERLTLIDQILSQNKIDSDISERMEHLRASLRPLQRHVDEAFKFVDRIEVECKEVYEEALGSAKALREPIISSENN